MKVTVLGCGSSGGVPLIGNNWGNCDPTHRRNRRTRVSILVETSETTLIVDTSPDMREQLLGCELKKLDAVLFTHAHADHCHGIDELRSINWLTQKAVDIFADPLTMAELKERFAYIFNRTGGTNFYRPAVVPHEVEGEFVVGDLAITAIPQNHGNVTSMGYRFGDLTYSTDVHNFEASAFEALRGTKIWIVDCVREEPHPTHSHLSQTLKWIAEIKPERAYLTHMNHTMDYANILAKLPAGVEPAYDGLVIEC